MLNKSIVVYHSNDQEGTVTISTVGENVQCSIQVFHLSLKVQLKLMEISEKDLYGHLWLG